MTPMRDWLATNTTVEELEQWGPATVLALAQLIDNLEDTTHDDR